MRVVAGLLVLAFLSVWARSADNLPRGFTRHGEAWTIRYVKVVDGNPVNDAETYCPSHRIDVRSDIKGRELAKSLLHEIMHALACDPYFANDKKWNNSDDKDDGYEGHEGIYWGSEELLAFMQDNPQFVEFLVRTK